jgi:hypothetical protein
MPLKVLLVRGHRNSSYMPGGRNFYELFLYHQKVRAFKPAISAALAATQRFSLLALPCKL